MRAQITTGYIGGERQPGISAQREHPSATLKEVARRLRTEL